MSGDGFLFYKDLFRIKIHARELISGKSIHSFLLFFSPLLTFLSGMFCIIVSLMCIAYGNEACFGHLEIFPLISTLSVAIPLFFLCAGCVLFLFTAALSATRKAFFFHLADKTSLTPISNISVRLAFRYLKKSIILFLIKLLWCICFFSPFLICCAVIFSSLSSNGISKSIFIILSILALILLITGALFFSVSLCRFALTDYILCTSPRISAIEAIRASVLLSAGKSAYILRSKLLVLPWKIAGISFLIFPFAYAYSTMINTLVCQKCYCENKYKKISKSYAVTFIIDSKTKMHKIN